MTDETFQKMDEALMKAAEKYRKQEVPKAVLSGFSADVTQSIRKRQAQKTSAPSLGFRVTLPVLAPVFAVLVLGVYIVLRDPGTPKLSLQGQMVQPASNKVSDVDEEIAVLKAIGAWTEEDERAAGMTGDMLDEMEISSLSGNSAYARLA